MSFIDGWNSNQINDWFGTKSGEHPNIIKKYLRGEISIETLTILNSILNFTKRYDKEVSDPLYKEVKKLCEKYQPFLKFDKQKAKMSLQEFLVKK
jgi:hypothetical protein